MRLPSRLRPLHFLVGAVIVLASVPTPLLAATGHVATASPVHGLIVQLRDAPSHVALARERAQAQSGGVLPPESARWQRLVDDLRADGAVLRELPGWARAAPLRDPVGESAQVLRFEHPLSAEQAERIAARLAARPEVLWVSANARERRQGTALNAPNDPYFAGTAQQWWLQPVQGSDGSPLASRLRGVPDFLPAWLNGSNGSAAAVVAVLDSGITCHPDLGNFAFNKCIGGAILPGYDFVTDSSYANDGDGRDSDPRDPGDWVSQADKSADPGRFGDCAVEASSWHGTSIAGIVAAQTDNGVGGAAINWNGRVVPVRVAGKCGADPVDIIEGMRWAVGLSACKVSDGVGGCAVFAPRNAHPARIINISFGGDAACSRAYQTAIDQVRAVGAVVVAAAGNSWGKPTRPASCQNVIGVAALNRDGFKTNYSNFGAAIAIATVGGDDGDGDSGAWAALVADSGVLTIGNSALASPSDCAQPGASCYFYHFGTSFSAPIVAGAISLMLSVNPALSATEIVQGLAKSARPHVQSSIDGFGNCSDSNPGRCLCTTTTCGAGILDAAQALLYAANPAGYVNTRGPDIVDSAELSAAVASGPDRPANAGAVAPPPSGGGGGATSLGWLLGLLVATLALAGPLSWSAPTVARVPAWRKTRSRPPAGRC